MGELELMPHQIEISNHIINKERCIIVAPMGCGKTLSVIHAIISLGCKTLIVAPLRVATEVWSEEISKMKHLKELSYSVLAGESPQEREIILSSEQKDVTLVNFELLPWFASTESTHEYELLVVDECSFLRSARSRQGSVNTAALRSIAPKIKRFVGLTGTPTPNGVIDLWGQVYFCDWGLRLGRTYKAFLEKYFIAQNFVNFAKYRPKKGSEKSISEKIKDIYIRISRVSDGEYVKKEEKIALPLTSDFWKLYLQLKSRRTLKINDGDVEVKNNAELGLKFLQLCSGTVRTVNGWERIHQYKLEKVKEIIRDTGEPVIIVYLFVDNLLSLQQEFGDRAVLVRSNGDKKAIEKWNSGEKKILLMHPKAASHGLNLQYGGRRLIFYNPLWSLEAFEQTINRVGALRQQRIGKNVDVIVHELFIAGTIEQRIIKERGRKKKLQDYVKEELAGHLIRQEKTLPFSIQNNFKYPSQQRLRGRPWERIRAEVFRQNPLCVHCQLAGLSVPATEVDHRIPLSGGGSESFENYQGLCENCHKEKTSWERRGVSNV